MILAAFQCSMIVFQDDSTVVCPARQFELNKIELTDTIRHLFVSKCSVFGLFSYNVLAFRIKRERSAGLLRVEATCEY